MYGNLSAPWLVLPFLAGVGCRSSLVAALAGLVASLAALCGFYAQTLDFALPLAPRALADVIMFPHASYFVGGTITGPLFGWLGGLWAGRRWRPAALALMLVLEPPAWWAWGLRFASPPRGWMVISAVEGGLGLAAAGLILSGRAKRPQN